jgi:hypothetical protein
MPAYFGYYASAARGVWSGSAVAAGSPPTFTKATSAHANVTWMESATDTDDLAKLVEAKSLGVQAIIDLHRFLFDDAMNLLPGWDTTLTAYIAKVQPYVADGTILAFYPKDEPYSVGPPATVLGRLEQVGTRLHALCPTTPIAVSIASTQVDLFTSLNLIPKSFNWVDVHGYGDWITNAGEGKSIPWALSVVKAHLYPGQALFLIPRGTVEYNCGLGDLTCAHRVAPSAADIALLLTEQQNYYQLALSEPLVVGIFPFLYQSFQTSYATTGGWYMTGTADLPAALDRYNRYGTALIENNPDAAGD